MNYLDFINRERYLKKIYIAFLCLNVVFILYIYTFLRHFIFLFSLRTTDMSRTLLFPKNLYSLQNIFFTFEMNASQIITI